jgi:hypothetical protein
MPNIIATKTIVFTDHLHVSGGEVHVKVNPAPGAQEIPDWALKTKTYEMAIASGAICLIGEVNPGPADAVLPPTMELLLSYGLNTNEAEAIFTEQQRKAEAGEPPYAPKTEAPLTTPTVDSLVAAGLDRASAEKFIADREKGASGLSSRRKPSSN